MHGKRPSVPDSIKPRRDIPPYNEEVVMRIGTVLVLIWLLIGVLAAGQRHYYSGSATNCAKAGTIAATIVAGPLNYLGANPKVKCRLPQPSK
jgi:hypothetical protein